MNMERAPRAKTMQEEILELEKFIIEIAIPTFESLQAKYEEAGFSTKIRSFETSASLIVTMNGSNVFIYRIQWRRFPTTMLPYADIQYKMRNSLRFLTYEQMIRKGKPDYSLNDISQEELRNHVEDNFEKRVHV
ncbi:MAG: hypothetical protein PF692_05595 [Kiritimatiellae bacterium]|jgi:hypothetical protein|nr:hypothetical protein [Kiritimatiellia bacterium]